MKNDDDLKKAKVLSTLTHHIGEEHAIDMGVLFREVFGEEFNHKINDTRRLRTLITEFRHDGIPIGSTARKTGGGYYLIRSGSELKGYCQRIHMAALRKLKMESRIKKMSLEELLGQMILNLRRDQDDRHQATS